MGRSLAAYAVYIRVVLRVPFRALFIRALYYFVDLKRDTYQGFEVYVLQTLPLNPKP